MKKYWIIAIIIVVLVVLFMGTTRFDNWKNLSNQEERMKLTSSAFLDGERIPTKYTCDGNDINPSLKIENVPDETVSLVLIMYDIDAPSGTWTHWILFNIPSETTEITEDSAVGAGGVNSWNEIRYGGPCPPSGTHRYIFKLYALDITLDLENANKSDIENAMQNHVLDEIILTGVYSRN